MVQKSKGLLKLPHNVDLLKALESMNGRHSNPEWTNHTTYLSNSTTQATTYLRT